MSRLHTLIIRHEGLRHSPYKDSVGKLTIGVGHNLDVPISDAAVMQILRDDVNTATQACWQFPWFDDLNKVRQAVVIDMVFNLGITGFSRFKKTIKLIATGAYEKTSVEMLKSKWAVQVGRRATELATMMKTGEW